MKLTVDMSAAPEIARLAEAVTLLPAPQAAKVPVTPQLTLGALAGRLRTIAAAPERWWGLARFDPDRPARIAIDHDQSYDAWLMVLPPGDMGQPCDCDAVTMIAGEATEGAVGGAALRPGPIRVHDQPHRLRGHGTGYTVSLHARARRA